MKDLKKLLSTGCVFLCLGGWVCDVQVRGEDAAKGSKGRGDGRGGSGLRRSLGRSGNNAPADNTPTTNPSVENTATTNPGSDNTAAATEPAAGFPTNPEFRGGERGGGRDGRTVQRAGTWDINTALHFLSLQSHRNIIASKEVKGTVTANLYNVTFQEALDSLLKPNGFDYIEKGNFIYVYTEKELEDIRKRDRHTVNHVFRLHYVNATDAVGKG